MKQSSPASTVPFPHDGAVPPVPVPVPLPPTLPAPPAAPALPPPLLEGQVAVRVQSSPGQPVVRVTAVPMTAKMAKGAMSFMIRVSRVVSGAIDTSGRNVAKKVSREHIASAARYTSRISKMGFTEARKRWAALSSPVFRLSTMARYTASRSSGRS